MFTEERIDHGLRLISCLLHLHFRVVDQVELPSIPLIIPLCLSSNDRCGPPFDLLDHPIHAPLLLGLLDLVSLPLLPVPPELPYHGLRGLLDPLIQHAGEPHSELVEVQVRVGTRKGPWVRQEAGQVRPEGKAGKRGEAEEVQGRWEGARGVGQGLQGHEVDVQDDKVDQYNYHDPRRVLHKPPSPILLHCLLSLIPPLTLTPRRHILVHQ